MLFKISVFLCLLLSPIGAALALVATAAGTTLPRSELTYVGATDEGTDVFLYDSARGRTYNLTHMPGYDLSPAWSPDGEQIAFVSDRDGGLQVFVADANGRNLRRLTPDGRAFEYPRWSVDGQRVIVMARTSFSPDVFAVSAEGGPLELISSQSNPINGVVMDLGIETAGSGGPFSPAGTGYLSARFTGSEWGLFLSASEDEPGVLLAALGPIASDFIRASWSNDGQHIAYLSAEQGSVDLYLRPPEPGAPALRLTHNSLYERDLVWRP